MPKRATSGSHTAEDTPVTKKARTSDTSVDKILNLSEASLKALKKDTLVEHIVSLQTAWFNFQAQNANGNNSQASSTAIMDPAKINEKANKASNMMCNGIKTQMKWQPSCKTSGKKWSYEGVVASPEVFYRLFRLEPETKEWKQKKISRDDLHHACGGSINAPIRYASLRITSEQITLKWDKENNSFSVSGRYGL